MRNMNDKNNIHSNYYYLKLESMKNDWKNKELKNDITNESIYQFIDKKKKNYSSSEMSKNSYSTCNTNNNIYINHNNNNMYNNYNNNNIYNNYNNNTYNNHINRNINKKGYKFKQNYHTYSDINILRNKNYYYPFENEKVTNEYYKYDFVNSEKREYNIINDESYKIEDKTDMDNDILYIHNNSLHNHQPTINNNTQELYHNNNYYNNIYFYEPCEKDNYLDSSIKDIYFDIYSNDTNENIKNKTNDIIDVNEKCNKYEENINISNDAHEYKTFVNDDKQLLLDHIKRLEYQNNIFLNNMLNMYYVCIDYIKLQDDKIKKHEQVINSQKEFISNLKKKLSSNDNTNIAYNLNINHINNYKHVTK
ncbi:conserved Plasmodium protein, unknown function [Plasmodium sp. gorilla clade G3]|nr:conserved Plasmodium protein, unknown function [Plasmodium sp. gorilla clade G3]